MSTEPPAIAITLGSYGAGTITVDGHDISHHVRGISIDAKAAGEPDIELDMSSLATRIEVARATIDTYTAVTLMRLGWTPPPEQAEYLPSYDEVVTGD